MYNESMRSPLTLADSLIVASKHSDSIFSYPATWIALGIIVAVCLCRYWGIRSRDKEVEELHNIITSKSETISEYKNKIAEQSDTIAEQRANLRDNKIQIETNNVALSLRDRKITTLENTIRVFQEDSIFLPELSKLLTTIVHQHDVKEEEALRYRAYRAADIVSSLKNKLREMEGELIKLRHYEGLMQNICTREELEKIPLIAAIRFYKDYLNMNDLMKGQLSCITYIRMFEDKMRLESSRKIESNNKLTEQKIALKDGQVERMKNFLDTKLDIIKNETLNFPFIMKFLDECWEASDQRVLKSMLARGASTSAEIVKETKKENRALRREVRLLQVRTSVYESIAPWVEEYMGCTVQELLTAKEEEEEFSKASDEERDRLFLSAAEYGRLNEVERSQLALKRYWENRVRKNLWLVGIQYERYIGYLYESKGYKVKYQGAVMGKEDQGIDLIATKGKTVHVIQCKRYSEIKRIPVRENSVAQIFGAAEVYRRRNGIGRVVPVLITSFELSDTARSFAEALNINIKEHIQLEWYPCIKCNISRNGDKIFHLPFDQQYDSVIIEPEKGEFYAESVMEAYTAGFRRAYRWHGAAKP